MTYIPSHLKPFSDTLPIFSTTKPGFTDFVVGGLIFSTSNTTPSNEENSKTRRILLLQRSHSDSYGGYWEGPGGGLDPAVDGTILEGAAREVREESGLHVARFIDLVSVDEWSRVKGDVLHVVAKFTFLVEVHEAVSSGSGRWEDGVRLEETEHQAFAWATEEEVREGIQGRGPYRFVGDQGGNLLKAFELVKRS